MKRWLWVIVEDTIGIDFDVLGTIEEIGLSETTQIDQNVFELWKLPSVRRVDTW